MVLALLSASRSLPIDLNESWGQDASGTSYSPATTEPGYKPGPLCAPASRLPGASQIRIPSPNGTANLNLSLGLLRLNLVPTRSCLPRARVPNHSMIQLTRIAQ